MKKKVLLFFASAVVALLCVSACSSDDNNEGQTSEVKFTSLDFAPKALQSKEDLSPWLLAQVEQLEDIHGIKAAIYKGVWHGKQVFYIYNSFSSCALCDVFWEDGNRIEWQSSEESIEFTETSANWTCIYYVVNGYEFSSEGEQSTYDWTESIVGQVRDQTGTVRFNSSNSHWIIFSHTEGTIDDAVVYYPVNLPDSLKSENLSVIFSGDLAEINNLPIVGGQKNYRLRLIAIHKVE